MAVGPRDTIDDLAAVADAVVCVETPAVFRAVGAYYHDFAQVSDEEAIEYVR